MSIHIDKPASTLFSRRRFLMLAWRGLMGLIGSLMVGGVIRFFSYQTGPKRKTQFELGPLDDFPPDSVKPIAEAQAIVVHTPAGLYALSALCPHLGCQIEFSNDGLVCPCHASRFDLNGERVNGPAQQSLRRLRLELSGDKKLILFIDPV